MLKWTSVSTLLLEIDRTEHVADTPLRNADLRAIVAVGPQEHGLGQRSQPLGRNGAEIVGLDHGTQLGLAARLVGDDHYRLRSGIHHAQDPDGNEAFREGHVGAAIGQAVVGLVGHALHARGGDLLRRRLAEHVLQIRVAQQADAAADVELKLRARGVLELHRRGHKERLGANGDDFPGPFVEGRRREPVVEVLRLAGLEPEAELPALGREPEALFGPVVVEVPIELSGGDVLVVDEAEAETLHAAAGRGHHAALPLRADGHAGPVVVGQFDELGMLGQEFTCFAVGHRFAFRFRRRGDGDSTAGSQGHGQDHGKTVHHCSSQVDFIVQPTRYQTAPPFPSPLGRKLAARSPGFSRLLVYAA